MKLTNTELNYIKIIKQFFPGCHAEVTLDYTYRLKLLRQYLQNVYGNLADWNISLKKFLSLLHEDKTHNSVFSVDDIELVSEDKLTSIIAYDMRMNNLAKEAKACVEKWRSHHSIDAIIRACNIFGILPSNHNEDTLNHFLVNFPANENEIVKLRTAIVSNPSLVGILGMAADVLSIAYEDQYLVTYPIIGTLVTQPRTVSYYRGENAYYQTSRPSFYRSKQIQRLPKDLREVILKMKYDECGCRVLDRFKVIVDWTREVSDCNFFTIMQHYGLPTGIMDITSDFKVALFFACCKYVGKDRLAHWEPLRREDFEAKNSRKNVAKLGGDSRFGVIYRTSSELADLLLMNTVDFTDCYKDFSDLTKEILQIYNHIIPVGYQPFHRSGLQSAYMLMPISQEYDMLKDLGFAKIKFRLNENLCEWVYHEMNRGNKIYPRDDAPELSKYISLFSQNNIMFSRSTFDSYCKANEITGSQAEALEERLLEYGYMIADRDIEYISDKEVLEINRRYTIKDTIKKLKLKPSVRPFIFLY